MRDQAAQAEQSPHGQISPLLVTPGPGSFSELVKTVKPAVVNISITGRAPGRSAQPFGGQEFRGFPEGSPFEEFFREYFGNRGSFGGQPGMRERSVAPEFRAVGSGFIISDDGYVVTNNHVIEHAEEIEVVLQDGTRYEATVQGRDPKTDLALAEGRHVRGSAFRGPRFLRIRGSG